MNLNERDVRSFSYFILFTLFFAELSIIVRIKKAKLASITISIICGYFSYVILFEDSNWEEQQQEIETIKEKVMSERSERMS